MKTKIKVIGFSVLAAVLLAETVVIANFAFGKKDIKTGNKADVEWYDENGTEDRARAVDGDSGGGLVVTDDDGNERILRSGEITVRLRGGKSGD